jgi:cysteine synthase/rhodanese-related sulfurtransferase
MAVKKATKKTTTKAPAKAAPAKAPPKKKAASTKPEIDEHRLRVYDSMLGMLSNADNPTPMVRLHRVVPFQHARVYAKLEWYNPFGAVKDRVAAHLIEDAETRGTIGKGKKLVEPTSGNTGMGLAMIANAKGYELSTPLSKAIPLEKRNVLRFFGSNVIELSDDLCPAPGAPEGAIAMAMQMGRMPGFHMLNQYANPANPEAHYRTTGPEIWRQTSGEVTHFIAGLGTCGTITGTGRFLKEQNAKVKVLGVAPIEGHDIPGVRSYSQLKQTEFYKPEEYDGTIEVNNAEAFGLCARLNREESIIAGPSSAMALAGALKMVPDEPGVIAVVIFPDNIFKYTSSVAKHLKHFFPPAEEGTGSTKDAALASRLLENFKQSPDVIDTGQMEDMLADGRAPVLIDVRPPTDYESMHAENSINVPLADIERKLDLLPKDRSTPIVTLCNVGNISLTAALVLKSLGYRNAMNFQGGLNAWAAEGLPTS